MECAHCHRDKPGKEYIFYYGAENELSHEHHSWGRQGYAGSGWSSSTTYGFDIQGQDKRFICNECVFKFYDWRVPALRILRPLAVTIIGGGALFQVARYIDWFFIPVILILALLVLFGLSSVPLRQFLKKRSEKDKFFGSKRHIYRRQDILELWAADLAGVQQNLFTTFEKRAYIDKVKLSFFDWLNKIWNPIVDWFVPVILFIIGVVIYYQVKYF